MGYLMLLQPQNPELHLVFLHGFQGLEYSSLSEELIRKLRDKEIKSPPFPPLEKLPKGY